MEIMKADGTSVNFWIEPQETTVEEPAHYGNELTETIKAKTENFSKISYFKKFVLSLSSIVDTSTKPRGN